ncbi:MAG: hypothetical protein KDK27_08575 [Leptospiraceae bacterium]|nr:hypothetical protein [Leptospiraceae bacterium]
MYTLILDQFKRVPAYCFCALLLFPDTVFTEPSDPDRSESSLNEYLSTIEIEHNYQLQIDCSDSDCVRFEFDISDFSDRLDDAMETGRARILIRFPPGKYKLESDDLEDVLTYMREIARRDGQVSIEPIHLNTRGESGHLSIPLLGDLITVGYDIFSRTYTYFRYSATGQYHARLIYNPIDRTIIEAFFVHRGYGDICTTLYTECEVVEYLDDELFDAMLSARLASNRSTGRPVRVRFNRQAAYVPAFELSLQTLERTDDSLRLYKWLIAAGATERRSTHRERFIGLEAAVAAIKYSIQVYDLIQAVRMYAPARDRIARVVYKSNGTPDGAGAMIDSVVFAPLPPDVD